MGGLPVFVLRCWASVIFSFLFFNIHAVAPEIEVTKAKGIWKLHLNCTAVCSVLKLADVLWCRSPFLWRFVLANRSYICDMIKLLAKIYINLRFKKYFSSDINKIHVYFKSIFLFLFLKEMWKCKLKTWGKIVLFVFVFIVRERSLFSGGGEGR